VVNTPDRPPQGEAQGLWNIGPRPDVTVADQGAMSHLTLVMFTNNFKETRPAGNLSLFPFRLGETHWDLRIGARAPPHSDRAMRGEGVA
jgi:hypothetical protein